jgi:TRAP-type uncharacterized transport system fused permease subunit
MTVLAAMCFASVLQGWFLTRNKIWEAPLLLAATAILFNPAIPASILKIDMSMKYYLYLPGLAIMGLVYAGQWYRKRRE